MKYLVLVMGALIAAPGSIIASSGAAPSELEDNVNKMKAPAFFERNATAHPGAYATWECIKQELQEVAAFDMRVQGKIHGSRREMSESGFPTLAESIRISEEINKLEALKTSVTSDLRTVLYKVIRALKTSIENSNQPAIISVGQYLQNGYQKYKLQKKYLIIKAILQIRILIDNAPRKITMTELPRRFAALLNEDTSSMHTYGNSKHKVMLAEALASAGERTDLRDAQQTLEDMFRWASQRRPGITLIFTDEMDAIRDPRTTSSKAEISAASREEPAVTPKPSSDDEDLYS